MFSLVTVINCSMLHLQLNYKNSKSIKGFIICKYSLKKKTVKLDPQRSRYNLYYKRGITQTPRSNRFSFKFLLLCFHFLCHTTVLYLCSLFFLFTLWLTYLFEKLHHIGYTFFKFFYIHKNHYFAHILMSKQVQNSWLI